jgi:hypothetical protein
MKTVIIGAGISVLATYLFLKKHLPFPVGRGLFCGWCASLLDFHMEMRRDVRGFSSVSIIKRVSRHTHGHVRSKCPFVCPWRESEKLYCEERYLNSRLPFLSWCTVWQSLFIQPRYIDIKACSNPHCGYDTSFKQHYSVLTPRTYKPDVSIPIAPDLSLFLAHMSRPGCGKYAVHHFSTLQGL